MVFDSLVFFIFLVTVFLLYWHVFSKNLKWRNFFLLLVSYIFYGWWDWRFLSLILLSTSVDYLVGLQLSKADDLKKRKIIIGFSLLFNLGLLGFFKYFNFFIESFADLLGLFNIHQSVTTLKVILPVGISFYTFQSLSYTLDVYKRKIEPCKDVVAFFAYVSFFPQLVAGPIERAGHLLPEFYSVAPFNKNNAVEGLKFMLWGFFKKIVIADNCGIIADNIFGNYPSQSGETLIIGAVNFAFQIYGDFSGYSDIAIGVAKLFGFELMRNFATPYLAVSVPDFWRRWHISLTTWFKDYVFISLGGSREGVWKTVRNTFIVFIVSGFWHGANWTFIVWGLINALYYLPSIFYKKVKVNITEPQLLSFTGSFNKLANIIATFILITLAWIFFRSENIRAAIEYYSGIIHRFSFKMPDGVKFLPLMLLLFIWEWKMENKPHGLAFSINMNKYLKWGIYLFLIFSILNFAGRERPFIYFQF